jgi:hypothetical protein
MPISATVIKRVNAPLLSQGKAMFFPKPEYPDIEEELSATKIRHLETC